MRAALRRLGEVVYLKRWQVWTASLLVGCTIAGLIFLAANVAQDNRDRDVAAVRDRNDLRAGQERLRAAVKRIEALENPTLAQVQAAIAKALGLTRPQVVELGRTLRSGTAPQGVPEARVSPRPRNNGPPASTNPPSRSPTRPPPVVNPPDPPSTPNPPLIDPPPVDFDGPGPLPPIDLPPIDLPSVPLLSNNLPAP